jgi:hypothetical protein
VSRDRLPDRETVAFRTAIVDACGGGSDRFYYVDKDRFVGVCPACDRALGVTFAGVAPRAELRCETGCSELDVMAAVRGGLAR